MYRQHLLATLVCVVLALLSSCTGSSSTGQESVSRLTPQKWMALGHGQAQPPSTGLPAVPLDNETDRSLSAMGGNPVSGAEYLLQDGCTIEGTSLHLNTGRVVDPGSGFDRPIGWAMYGIGGLAGKRAVSLNVQCVPDGPQKHYFVGVADYTRLNWHWSGPVYIPEYQFDLSKSNSRYISNLGNLYFLVVCYGDNSATHSQSTVVLGDGRGGLPGAPHGLVASKGEFPDGVALHWLPGPGAASYEIQRSLHGPNGDPSGGNPGAADWQTIGASQEPGYFDMGARPGEVFYYRVRGVNEAGVSVWSNIDFGFTAGPPPPPPGGDYPLQGTVFAGGPNGGPMPLPGVLLTVISPDGTVSATAETDQNGFYFVPQLDPGAYVVTPTLDAWSFDPPESYFEITAEQPSVWIDFFAHNRGGGGGDPGAGMGVYGFAFGPGGGDPNGGMPPLAGVKITVSGGGAVADETFTDEQGFYQFVSFPPGVYTITASKDGYYFDETYTFEVTDATLDYRFDFFGRAQ